MAISSTSSDLLGVLPASHAGRARFLAEADRSVLDTIDLGVLFLMAFWSGPSWAAFTRFKQVLTALDPTGRLELVVVDIDGCPDLCATPEFLGRVHGSGEVAWLRDRQVVFTSGRGHRPDHFESCTRQLLATAAVDPRG